MTLFFQMHCHSYWIHPSKALLEWCFPETLPIGWDLPGMLSAPCSHLMLMLGQDAWKCMADGSQQWCERIYPPGNNSLFLFFCWWLLSYWARQQKLGQNEIRCLSHQHFKTHLKRFLFWKWIIQFCNARWRYFIHLDWKWEAWILLFYCSRLFWVTWKN